MQYVSHDNFHSSARAMADLIECVDWGYYRNGSGGVCFERSSLLRYHEHLILEDCEVLPYINPN